jgi:hypothetical protein
MSTAKAGFNWQTHIQVIGKISTAIVANRQRLDLGHKASSSAELAWSARNLLELLVWSRYCVKSEENARNFLEESLRDIHMLLTVPDELLIPGESLTQQREKLLSDAAQDGWANVDKRFTQVSSIAESMGIKQFGKLNMILSKYAHPTALSIIEPDFADSFKEMIYVMGANYYTAGLSECKTFLEHWAKARPQHA